MPRTIRVLVLDNHSPFKDEALQNAGIELAVTMLSWDEVVNDFGNYYVSDSSLELASRAWPELYDFVVIGNNRNTGVPKAKRIPPQMRDQTAIVWNIPPWRDDSAPYLAAGFTHFHTRDDATQWLLEQPGVRADDESDDIVIAELGKRCKFDTTYQINSTSFTCNAAATSIVIDPEANRMRLNWRCYEHEGRLKGDSIGRVETTVPRSLVSQMA